MAIKYGYKNLNSITIDRLNLYCQTNFKKMSNSIDIVRFNSKSWHRIELPSESGLDSLQPISHSLIKFSCNKLHWHCTTSSNSNVCSDLDREINWMTSDASRECPSMIASVKFGSKLAYYTNCPSKQRLYTRLLTTNFVNCWLWAMKSRKSSPNPP